MSTAIRREPSATAPRRLRERERQSPGPAGGAHRLCAHRGRRGERLAHWSPVDGADSYRIYRDGFTIGDRYGRIDAEEGEFEFDDPDPGIEPHQYWITAVDAFLQESLLVGPVSLGGAEPGDPPPPTEPLEPDAVPPEPLP